MCLVHGKIWKQNMAYQCILISRGRQYRSKIFAKAHEMRDGFGWKKTDEACGQGIK